MSTNLRAFDSTIQTTHAWLNELAALGGWSDSHRSYLALRAVLHALRDRLSVDAAAALGAQLPMLVRGFYYESWHPHGKPLRGRKLEEFLAPIRAAFHQEPDLDTERMVRIVFRLLANHVTAGEIEKLKYTLPEAIRSLWPEEVRVLPL